MILTGHLQEAVMGKGFGTVDPALFDLARTIAIAKVRLCYGRGDSCNRVVEKLKRMSNENYELTGEASVLSAGLGPPLRWEIEGTGLVIKLPFARGQLCVYLADPPLPVKILLGDFMPPEGIDIDHGKCCIFLFGDFDLYGIAAIVYQIMSVKEALPVFTPPLLVKSPHDKDPVDRIMGIGCWREWPSHIRVDHGQEEVGILCVPTLRFEINHLLNLFHNRGTHEFLLLYRLTTD
jgi:hypothetical protein